MTQRKKRKYLIRFSLLVIATILLLSLNSNKDFSSALSKGDLTSLPQPVTKIKHIVVIMQENHAFDNFFGTFPGLSSGFNLSSATCNPYNLKNLSQGCLLPWKADSMSSAVESQDLPHVWSSSLTSYDNKKMDGFLYAAVQKNSPHPNFSMAYYTGNTIPNYWDYASYYALDANFFSSVLSSSYPQHLYMVAAQGGPNCTGPKCNPLFNLTFPTIITQLNTTGIDWRYYSGTWSDSLDCTTMPTTQSFSQAWIVLPDFPAIQLGQSTCHKQQNLNDLFKNLTAGYLPQVAWITPNNANSDHPGGTYPVPKASLTTGQLYITRIVNAISNSSLWNSTAIFVTWDEGGGYYDNVVPTQVSDHLGYGFRVPLLVISPYVNTNQGHIFYGPNGQQQDFTAFLSTIEQNWGLKNLTARDGNNPSLFSSNLFNFSQSPLPPLFLPSSVLATYPLSSCTSCHAGFGLSPAAASGYLVSAGTSTFTQTSDSEPLDD